MAAGARLLDSLYISGAGSAAASGSVSFYQVGTLVPIVVYSDDALTQPQTQPIVLDSNGKTPLPVYSATPARAIIKTASGATLQDIARIDGDRAELVGVSNAAWTATDLNSVLTAIQSSVGGIDGKFLDAGSGAVARNIRDKFSEIQISVKDFGAVGNGVTDDTVAIQAAINRATTLLGGQVYFPAGTYLISAALSITVSGVDLVGAGPSASIIKGTNGTQNGVSILAATSTGNRVFGLRFSHSSSSTGRAIAPQSATTLTVDNVTTDSSWSYGLNVNAAAASTTYLSRSSISGSAFGVLLQTGTAYISQCSIATTAGTNAGLTNTGATAYVSGSVISGPTGIESSGSAATATFASSCAVTATAGYAAQVNTATGTLSLAACTLTGTSGSAFIAAGTGVLLIDSACVVSGLISDLRTAAAPFFYTFAANGNFTPLPLQAPAIRAIGTAGGITITVNTIAVTGWAKQWSLICSNASGGAVTWTFSAQYVLSAAVAPATGNRVNLLLEYNPTDNKVYEIGRAATAN